MLSKFGISNEKGTVNSGKYLDFCGEKSGKCLVSLEFRVGKSSVNA
jgi:hypothetical protein